MCVGVFAKGYLQMTFANIVLDLYIYGCCVYRYMVLALGLRTHGTSKAAAQPPQLNAIDIGKVANAANAS